MSLCDHPEFMAGNVNTDFIPVHKEKLFEFAKQLDINDETVCCSLAAILNHENEITNRSVLNSMLIKKLNSKFQLEINFFSQLDQLTNFWTNSSIHKDFNLVFDNQSKSSK